MAADQRPAAVALPVTVEEICHVVRTAARLDLRVSTQCTGHAAGALAQHPLDDVVLLRTRALRAVEVDPVGRTARVRPGRRGGRRRPRWRPGLVRPQARG